MRTTVDISDALLRDLRREATSTKRPFRVVLEETLHRGLSLPSKRGRNRKISIATHPAGIKPAFRSLSMNQLFDQIETEQDLKGPSSK